MSESVIKQHHGTCDMCESRNVLVTHYRYDGAADDDVKDFRLCNSCRILDGETIRMESIGVAGTEAV